VNIDRLVCDACAAHAACGRVRSAIEIQDDLAQVAAAAGLAAREVQVVALWRQRLTYKEIGAALGGISADTVATLIQRARGKVRDHAPSALRWFNERGAVPIVPPTVRLHSPRRSRRRGRPDHE
jgi:DNA-binding CsgD family transcriptional regulator